MSRDSKWVQLKLRRRYLSKTDVTGLGPAPSVGPGAAATSDPSFVGKYFGEAADLLNKTHDSVTAKIVDQQRDPNGRQALTTDIRDSAARLNFEYNRNPHFRTVVDAGRHYVHNNPAIVDASRKSIGMDVLNAHVSSIDHTNGDYYIRPTKMLNGALDNRYKMNQAEAIKHAENLHTAIREASETSIEKQRGMRFDGMLPSEMKEYLKFKNLKVRDKIDLPLTSFSTDWHTVNQFMSIDPKDFNVAMYLEGPHKSIKVVSVNHTPEFEHVTQGEFEVTKTEFKEPYEAYKVQGAKPLLKIYVKQTGVF